MLDTLWTWYVACHLLAVILGCALGIWISARWAVRTAAPKPARWSPHYYMLETPGQSVCFNMRQVTHYQFRRVPQLPGIGEPGPIYLSIYFNQNAPTVEAHMTHAEACAVYRTLTGAEPPPYLRAPDVTTAPMPAEGVTGSESSQSPTDTYQRKWPLQ